MEKEINIPCGIYRHYKGKTYEVIGMAKHSETLDDLVVYRALYGDMKMWVRPVSMWNEVVDTPNGKVKRFQLLNNET